MIFNINEEFIGIGFYWVLFDLVYGNLIGDSLFDYHISS